jgi:hypothetical protein
MSTLALVETLLAFAATLVSLRLTGEVLRRYRIRRSPELAIWAASLASFAVASGALAWGAAAGWDERVFRVYYACGGLLTAALLGLGSLRRAGVRVASGLALVWVGLGVGVAAAMQLDPAVTGTAIPDAATHLELVPARILAIVGNTVGALAAVAVALTGLRRRPRGNSLIVAGVVVAAVGSAVSGLGEGGSAVFATASAVLLYGGFVSSR